MMDADRIPQLSVVVIAYVVSHDLLNLIKRLSVQDRANSLELVIVTPSARTLSLDPACCEDFFSFQVVEVSNLKSVGQGKAAGVRAAQAPLVVFSEDHCRVAPGWADALIEAHEQQEFASVGPVMINANPDKAVSWACFLVFYGPWMGNRPGQSIDHLPGNQSCYRRNILLAYGQGLADALEAESLLHWELVEKGYQLRLESKAVVGHINHTRLRSLMEEHYLAARIFAYLRARRQAPLKRLIYAIGSPLIPVIRLYRIVRQVRDAGLSVGIVWRALLPTLLNLCAGAVGEALGYTLGAGKARERLVGFEASRSLNTVEH